MADTPLSASDLAEIMAESLDIPANSYGGREGDAIAAMTLVKGYRRMNRSDQTQVLYKIRDEMNFGTTHPAFFEGCRVSIALMTVNPVWIPGSLTNPELISELTFWRRVSSVLGKLGFGGVTNYVASNSASVFKEIKGNMLDPTKAGNVKAMIGGPLKAALRPNMFTGGIIFGNAAKTIADSSVSDLEAEAGRRGLTHEMSALDTAKYGSRP